MPAILSGTRGPSLPFAGNILTSSEWDFRSVCVQLFSWASISMLIIFSIRLLHLVIHQLFYSSLERQSGLDKTYQTCISWVQVESLPTPHASQGRSCSWGLNIARDWK